MQNEIEGCSLLKLNDRNECQKDAIRLNAGGVTLQHILRAKKIISHSKFVTVFFNQPMLKISIMNRRRRMKNSNLSLSKIDKLEFGINISFAWQRIRLFFINLAGVLYSKFKDNIPVTISIIDIMVFNSFQKVIKFWNTSRYI